MYRRLAVTATNGVEVTEDAVGDEWCDRRCEHNHGLQAGVECLVSRKLILAHSTAPETLTVEAHIPVREVLVDKLVDAACRRGWVVVLEVCRNIADKGIEFRENPAVDLWALLNRHLSLAARKAVDIGIEGEERVGVVERAEELTATLINAIDIELEVIPRLRVRDHIPARSVGAVLLEHIEWVDTVTEALRHLVTILIEHQAVRDDILEGHRVEEHSSDGVERIEPTTGLVDTLSDEVRRVYLVEALLSLEWVVHLRIRHST